MKRLSLLIVLLAITIVGLGQTTLSADRGVFRQSIYLKDSWADSFQKKGIFNSDRAIPTSKAVSDFVSNGAIKDQFTKSSDPDFEIVVIPDIQNMNYLSNTIPSRGQAGRSIFNWIAANKTSENIKFALQVGDITDQMSIREWDTAAVWFNILDAVNIPYVAAMGNHDYDSTWGIPRLNRHYNDYFGASRMSTKPHYVRYFDTDPEALGFANALYKINVGSKKYAILNLEYIPRDTTLGWAGKLLDSLYQAEPAREVMVLTHAYMTVYGELAKDTSRFSGDALAADNTGQEMWDKLVKKKPNIRWVFSGHYILPGTTNIPYHGRITAAGENGNIVEQIFVNYQDDTEGGNGYFMRMKFKPSQNKVDVSFYSDYEKRFDPRLKPFTVNEPPVKMVGDLGVSGNVSVNKTLRVAGDLKAETLSKGRIPYIGEDHKFKDSSNLRYTGDSLVAKLKVLVDGPFKVKGFAHIDTIKAPTGTLNLAGTRLQIHKGSQFDAPSNILSLWRDDSATTVNPSFNKVIEVNSYSTFLDGSNAGFHPNVLLARGYDLPGTTITYGTDYQSNVFGLFVGAGFITKPGVASTTVTAGTTPTQAIAMNLYKFVNQGAGTRAINGFVSNAKFALDAPAAGSITSYADVLAGTMQTGLGATITNRYAFYAADVSNAKVTNAYGFYQEGTNTKNFFQGKTAFGSAISLPVSTAPTSSSDPSGSDGDLIRDASGNLYLKSGAQWLKFTGATF